MLIESLEKHFGIAPEHTRGKHAAGLARAPLVIFPRP